MFPRCYTIYALLLLTCSCVSHQLGSQPVIQMTKQADSLRRLLFKLPDDRTKFDVYEDLASTLMGLDQDDSARAIAESSFKLASRLNDPRLMIRSYFVLAGCRGNYGSREYEKSLEYAFHAANLAEIHDLQDDLHNAYSIILNLYFYSGDFAKAMDISKKGLMVAEQRNDKEKISHYYNLFGFIHFRQGNGEEAEKYYTMYADLARERNDSVKMADSFNCLGEVFVSRKNYQKALDLHLRAWQIYQLSFRKGLNFKVDQLAYTAFRISNIYRLMGDYATALQFTKTGFEYNARIAPNEYDLVNYQLNTGELYKNIGDFKKSLTLFHQALGLSIKIKHLENIRDSYSQLAETYKAIGVYDSAYHYQVLFSTLKDSVVNEKSKREIERINAEYNLLKKDQAIAIQQAQLEQHNFQRNALIVFFIFSIAILFLLYGRYRLVLKNKFQQQLTIQQNELFTTIVTFQDTERKRIAQDIHDSVGSVLSAAKLQLSALDDSTENLSTEQLERYHTAMLLLDEATVEIRNIAHNIMPPALSRLGLVAALESLIDKIKNVSNLQINFNVFGFTERLSETTEIGIYPVMLELINNVLKHARASQAAIQLVRHPAYINITVEDNGKGFDLNKAQGKGMGLQNVRSRIQYLKGSVNIDSAEGRGTLIMIDIPY